MRIRELDRYAVSLYVSACPVDSSGVGQAATSSTTWRGTAAPAPPTEARHLQGRLVRHHVDSTALGAGRAVPCRAVHLPPVDGPVAGCVLADGESTDHYAPVLEHAMLTGLLPDRGRRVHSVMDQGPTWPDTRSQEYVPGHNRQRFAEHLAFVVDEVLPWARSDLAVDGQEWTAAGFSNGAAWAIAAAQHRPDVFSRVVALSPGVHPRRVGRRARAAGVRHYLAAGLLEPAFLGSAQKWADRRAAPGSTCGSTRSTAGTTTCGGDSTSSPGSRTYGLRDRTRPRSSSHEAAGRVELRLGRAGRGRGTGRGRSCLMCPAGLSGDTAVLVVTALTLRRGRAGAAHPVVVTGRQRLAIRPLERTSPSRPSGSRKNML